jgi:hypothetical protein
MNNAINYQETIDELVNLNKPIKRSFSHGLNLKVYESGKAVWIYRYSYYGKRKELLVDDTYVTNRNKFNLQIEGADLNYEEALLKVLELRRDHKISQIDPQISVANQKKRLETLNDIAEDFFENECGHLKYPDIPLSKYNSYVRNSIGKRLIADINTPMVLNLLRDIKHQGKPSISNDVLRLLKSDIFPHISILGLPPHNPALALTTKHAGGKERPRKRYLDIGEIGTVLATLQKNREQFTYPNYLAFVLLTIFGCRKMELLSAKWSDIDLAKQEKDETYEVINPIPDLVLCVFQHLKIYSNGSDYLFPNRKSGTKHGFVCENTLNSAVNKMFGVKKTKARKATANHFECMGINHKLKGIEGVYNRYDYFKERMEAFNIISNIIMPLAKIEKLEI